VTEIDTGNATDDLVALLGLHFETAKDGLACLGIRLALEPRELCIALAQNSLELLGVRIKEGRRVGHGCGGTRRETKLTSDDLEPNLTRESSRRPPWLLFQSRQTRGSKFTLLLFSCLCPVPELTRRFPDTTSATLCVFCQTKLPFCPCPDSLSTVSFLEKIPRGDRCQPVCASRFRLASDFAEPLIFRRASTTGVPTATENRYPQPGSRPELYAEPATKGASRSSH
jgi:hypothetical protein